jgi:hypothetical protein
MTLSKTKCTVAVVRKSTKVSIVYECQTAYMLPSDSYAHNQLCPLLYTPNRSNGIMDYIRELHLMHSSCHIVVAHGEQCPQKSDARHATRSQMECTKTMRVVLTHTNCSAAQNLYNRNGSHHNEAETVAWVLRSNVWCCLG